MTDNSHPSLVAKKIVHTFTQKTQQVKDFIKEIIEIDAKTEGEAEVPNFVQSIMQGLNETDRKIVKECWTDVLQSMQKSKCEKQQQLASVSGKHKEQEEESFKFDSHSESYSSSYEDVDDDFRKEEMQEQEQPPQ